MRWKILARRPVNDIGRTMTSMDDEFSALLELKGKARQAKARELAKIPENLDRFGELLAGSSPA